MGDQGEPSQQRITWFYQRYKEQALELAPPFQRKPVWGPKNNSYLIDSIIEGFPVPEIYLQTKTDSVGNTKYIVVDGQQRIRAILSFIDNGDELLEGQYVGKTFPDLPENIKQKIWNYRLVTRELLTDSEEFVREIFKRLNKNAVSLNRQELRNAAYVGRFIDISSKLAEDIYWTEQKIFSSADIKRMLDVEYVSELLIALLHGVQSKDQETIDKMYLAYDQEFDQEDDIKSKFTRTKEKVSEIIIDIKQTRWHYKLDYYSIFLAFSELMEKYYFPIERNKEILDALKELSKRLAKENPLNSYEKEYELAILTRRSTRENRAARINSLKGLIIPFLIAKDPTRNFTEEERRIFWEISEERNCGVCKKLVELKEYELDHITPHSKGGKTELKNAQITHKKCNASKSNNVAKDL